MDPTRLLEADHRDVEDLFDEIEKADGKDRTPLIEELATSLKAHMALEEEVLYPAIKPVVGDEPVQEGETEHELARKALADVERLGPDDPGFGAALEALKAGIEHHVEEEENDVFPEARRHGKKQLDEVATPFMARRMELGLPMKAEALSASANKDELLAEAENAGVDGASDMTKEQLADALARQMA